MFVLARMLMGFLLLFAVVGFRPFGLGPFINKIKIWWKKKYFIQENVGSFILIIIIYFCFLTYISSIEFI